MRCSRRCRSEPSWRRARRSRSERSAATRSHAWSSRSIDAASPSRPELRLDVMPAALYPVMYMNDHIPPDAILRPVAESRAGVHMRLDAGAILKRFHFLERALLISAAGWIPAVHSLEVKALLARTSWTGSLT